MNEIGVSDTPIKQQRLKAWEPILTASTVLPTLFLVGFLFISVGIGLLKISDTVCEAKIPYTDCIGEGTANKTCASIIEEYTEKDGLEIPNCVCKIHFTLEKDFKVKLDI